MVKLNFFIINLFILISFFNPNRCLSSEYIYIKQTFFSTDPTPSISATSTDETTKWFDDYPTAKSNNELEFGFYLPKNYGLSFRNSKLNGVHTGEATKYVCILGYCSYVGAGIVTGNSTTDKISYDINSWQVILDRSYAFKNRLTFKPRIGINVLDTILKYSGGNILNSNKLQELNKIDVLKSIGDHYVSLINKYDYTESIITDKAPLNFRWIGLIKLIFPNSKIIHCSRSPKDNCLSLYKNIFDENLDWTYDEDDLSSFYQLYADLMKFWKKNIPNFIYDISYENLISNPQNQIKDMLSFCDLKFEQNCMDFHKNKRAIKTVSSSQARNKIYSSSINSYKNYEKFLINLFSSLDNV